MDTENEKDDLENQYFQDKMFRVCAKAIINEEIYINRLYESDYYQGMAERAQNDKEKAQFLEQKRQSDINSSRVKQMFYECFNRYFYVYGVLQQVAHDDDE